MMTIIWVQSPFGTALHLNSVIEKESMVAWQICAFVGQYKNNN